MTWKRHLHRASSCLFCNVSSLGEVPPFSDVSVFYDRAGQNLTHCVAVLLSPWQRLFAFVIQRELGAGVQRQQAGWVAGGRAVKSLKWRSFPFHLFLKPCPIRLLWPGSGCRVRWEGVMKKPRAKTMSSETASFLWPVSLGDRSSGPAPRHFLSRRLPVTVESFGEIMTNIAAAPTCSTSKLFCRSNAHSFTSTQQKRARQPSNKRDLHGETWLQSQKEMIWLFN